MKIYHIALSKDGYTGVIITEQAGHMPDTLLDMHKFADNDKAQNMATLLSYAANDKYNRSPAVLRFTLREGCDDRCIVVSQKDILELRNPMYFMPPLSKTMGTVFRWGSVPVFEQYPNLATEVFCNRDWDQDDKRAKLRLVDNGTTDESASP